MSVLVRAHSHRAKGKLFALVGPFREELYSFHRNLYHGAYRIPERFEARAKAITGITGLRDGPDLHKCIT